MTIRLSNGSLPNTANALISYDTVNKPPIWGMGIGSSIELLPDLDGRTVGFNLWRAVVMALNPGTNGFYNFQYDEEGVGQSVVSQYPAALASAAGKGVTPKFCAVVYGENCFQTPNYNSGPSWGNGPTNLPACFDGVVTTLQGVACDPVLYTSHHYQIMDANNVPTLPCLPSNLPQYYPISKSAPVSCADQNPTCAAGLMYGDPVGLGVNIYWDARFWRGNQMIRSTAAKRKVPLIDAERASMLAIINYMIANNCTQAVAEAYYYGTSTPNNKHPLAVGMSHWYSAPTYAACAELAF